MKTRFFAATMLLLMMGAVTASAQTKTIDRGSQEAEKQARSGQTAAAGKTASQAVQSGRYSGGSTPGLADKVQAGCDRARANAEMKSGTSGTSGSGTSGSGTSNSNGTSNGSADKNNTAAKKN